MQWRMLIYKSKRIFHFFKTGLLQALPAMIKTNLPQNKLFIIGITGTDGKTTTSTLVHHILTQSGIKTGLITTLGAKIGNKNIETGLHVTNPTPSLLYQVLRKMVDEGCTHLVLEMTSHGAYQFRNFGIRPQIGAITNITHEHYDYHQNFTEYVKAKSSLFFFTPVVWVNANEQSMPQLKNILGSRLKTFTHKTNLKKSITDAINARFNQTYNRLNAKLAALICLSIDIKIENIAQAINVFPEISGRMQEVKNTRGFRTIVDFAHTPRAVEASLKALRSELPNKKTRLIVVFSSAGERDISKRPQMGKVAAKVANLVIFTAEDPRHENVWTIINQLKSDLGDNYSKVVSIPDRGQAIYFAINHIAKKGDIVAILGKGHEKSMCFGKQEYEWSDVEAVASALHNQLFKLGSLIT